MAYKARRTRDLQGQVVAGSDISVTQSVKPDGTKVYTLENTAPGSEYFTTERTEGGWAILNQDNNIVIASSSEFDFNEKGVTFFTKDGEPFAIIVGTKAQGNQELKILDANGNEVIVIGTGGIRVNDSTDPDKTTTLYPGSVQLTNEGGNTTVEISNSDIYIYNNDEGNDNLIIEHSDDCHIYVRNRNGNDGVLINTDENNPASIGICDADGNERIHLSPNDISVSNNDGNTTVSIDSGYGNLYLSQETGNSGISMECGGGDGGQIRCYDENGDDKAYLQGYDDDGNNNGFFKLCNENGNEMLNSWQLVDMVNAVIYWRMQTYNPFNYILVIGTAINEEIVSANNVRSSDYYETDDTNIDLGGDEYLKGIRVNYSGVYEIGILVSFSGVGGTSVVATFKYRIERENGSVDDLEDDEFSIFNGDSLLFTQTRIVELSAGDIICPLFETNSADILNANDDIRLSLKKLR